jgi:hypothetical protein
MQNLPLPTLRIVPLLLLLLVALLIVRITGILATRPLGTSTVHFVNCQSIFKVEWICSTCLECADRSRLRLEKRD